MNRTIATGSFTLNGLHVQTTTGTVTFAYREPEDPPTAGVREPRNPQPTPLAPMAAGAEPSGA